MNCNAIYLSKYVSRRQNGMIIAPQPYLGRSINTKGRGCHIANVL